MSNYETFVVPLLMGGGLIPFIGGGVPPFIGGGLSEQKFSLSCLIDTLKSEYIFSLH